MFHRHDYRERERFYAGPASAPFKGQGHEFMKYMERLAFGVTTILYTCESCGAANAVELLGRACEIHQQVSPIIRVEGPRR